MFSRKDKIEDAVFQQSYCKGFNVGISMVKHIPLEKREQAKELLHLMILEKPKDITFHSILTGFCYQIEQERSISRMKEYEEIEANNKSRELERGR